MESAACSMEPEIKKATSGGFDTDFLRRIAYLGKYLRPHKKILILSLVLTMVSTGLGMVQPYFAKLMIDRVFMAHDTGALIPLLSALVILIVVGFAVRTGNNYMYARYSAKILFLMREEMFAHLQKIPLSFFTRKKIGDIHSRIASDMADIQALITETIPHYLLNALTFVITAAILIWLNWKMALLSMSFLPFALLIIRAIRPKIQDLAGEVAHTNADIAHFLFESLAHTRLIRAFGAGEMETGKLITKQSRVLDILLRYQVLGAISGSVPTMFIIINTLVVFGYGGFLVLDGTLTVGGLVAFSIYQGRVLGPLQGLLDGFLAMQKARVALNRVGEIMDIEPVRTSAGDRCLDADEFKGNIVFDRVGFAYDDDEPVLNNLSFRIPAGKVTALVGPSGTGKTTICHLILKLFDPDSGRIMLDGIDLREIRTDWLRRRVSLVSQDIFLFHASIAENIGFSKPGAGVDEIREAARSACIHEFIQSLPNGYDTVVGDNGVRLSGGQKQRISIARSLLLDPNILVLDEATAFLDTSVEQRLKQTLHGLMKDRTVLVVSHRVSSFKHADKIIAHDATGLVYDGPAERYMDERTS